MCLFYLFLKGLGKGASSEHVPAMYNASSQRATARHMIYVCLSGDPEGHGSDLPRARLLQGEGRAGAGESVQRDEGVLPARP